MRIDIHLPLNDRRQPPHSGRPWRHLDRHTATVLTGELADASSLGIVIDQTSAFSRSEMILAPTSMRPRSGSGTTLTGSATC